MSKIIIPLDGMTESQAISLAKELSGSVWGFKVNDLLIDCGLSIITKLKEYGKVFADLKLNDIPNTVKNSVEKLSNVGTDLITVHSSGGRKMMEAALEGKKGNSSILGVTILTSFNDELCKEVFGVDTATGVKRLSSLSASSSLDGIVCSPKELSLLKENKDIDKMLKVIPGIRPSWYLEKDDQSRTTTPKEAIENGASLLVIGRPITGDKDPLEATKKVNDEINL